MEAVTPDGLLRRPHTTGRGAGGKTYEGSLIFSSEQEWQDAPQTGGGLGARDWSLCCSL